MQPLISVVIPCYNNASTLPFALASVMAQSMHDWECMVIDDGSTDFPNKAVSRFDDPRIRFCRFDSNKGRGAARQFGLEMAKGKYLAMVDADDWIYAGKLKAQVEILERDSQIALISSPLAVMDSQGITGIRGDIGIPEAYRTLFPAKHILLPTIVHAPSMIRMHIAKELGYTTSFHTTEDADLLARIIHRHPYAVMRSVTYAYSEYASASLSKMIQSYLAAIKISWRYRKHYLPEAIKQCLLYSLRIPLITGAFFSGFGNYTIARRSRKPSSSEIEEFNIAYRLVSDHLKIMKA